MNRMNERAEVREPREKSVHWANYHPPGMLTMLSESEIPLQEDLVARVINAERDSWRGNFVEANVPYLELAPGLRVIGEVTQEGFGGAPVRTCINYEQMNEMGLNEKTLMETALRNSMQKHPPLLLAFEGKQIGTENLLYRTEGIREGEIMHVLTTKDFMLGAIALFYPGIQERLSNIMGGNYYAVPSSVHEFIILPESDQYDENILAQMLFEANREVVNKDDVLTDTLYYYDSELGLLLSCREYGEYAM